MPNIVIEVPELNENEWITCRIVHAEVKKSKNGNEMLQLLLSENKTNITIIGYVLFNQPATVRSFARAVDATIQKGKVIFDIDELRDKEIKVKVGTLDSGDYVARAYAKVYDDHPKVEELSDPFAE